jgi:hypothetical protein
MFRRGERITVRAAQSAGAPDGPGEAHWFVDRLKLDWRPAGEGRAR